MDDAGTNLQKIITEMRKLSKEGKNDMTRELLYITDTYCIWCYGFSGSIKQLAEEYEGRINVKVVNGGMIPSDTPLSALFGRFQDPLGLHGRVTDMSGRQFGEKYLDHIKNLRVSTRKLNSSVPARALVAFKSLGLKDELGITDAIQQKYYMDGADLQDVSSYRMIADQLSVSFDAFLEAFNDPTASATVAAERRAVEAAGIQGFPAVLFRGGSERPTLISRGFLPIQELRSNLETALASCPPYRIDAAKSCSVDGGC